VIDTASTETSCTSSSPESPAYLWWQAAHGWLRDPALRTFRFLGVAYLALAVLYLLGDGKAYYLAGMYPALLAVGAIPVAA
jgi:hypothetical protein